MIRGKEKKPIATMIACCLSFLYGTCLFIFVRNISSYQVKTESKTGGGLPQQFNNILTGTMEIVSELDRLMFSLLISVEIMIVVILIAFIIVSIAAREVWPYIVVFSLSCVFLFNVIFFDENPIFVIVNILFIILIDVFAFYDYKRIKKQHRMRRLQGMRR